MPVVIVGAGPYGLATSAHLSAQGVEHRIFGEPMLSWVEHMPKGMLLRSRWDASHIADPDHALGLARYEELHGLERMEPVPLERFVDYGRWFQVQAVPHLEHRRIARIAAARSIRIEQKLRFVVAHDLFPFAAANATTFAPAPRSSRASAARN
jgi:FAD-dependent urate hydroxylase